MHQDQYILDAGALTLPVPLRFWCATNRKLAAKVHRIIIKNIEGHYIKAAKRSGVEKPEPGSITFVQHFGSALQPILTTCLS